MVFARLGENKTKHDLISGVGEQLEWEAGLLLFILLHGREFPGKQS